MVNSSTWIERVKYSAHKKANKMLALIINPYLNKPKPQPAYEETK